MKQSSIVLGLALWFGGCNVDRADADTGGIDLGGAGAAGRSGTEPQERPSVRGFAVFNSDYESTSVSLIDSDGEVLSEVFIASSSTSTGLSAPLSGDVVPPTMAAAGDELALIERTPASVLTWVDLETAEVRAQLSVATGFSANPHDYVSVSETKAYVTRFEPNLDAGHEPHDAGDDVLVVDPSRAAITGRIDLGPALDGEPDQFFARPDRALLAGGQLRVAVAGLNADFSDALDSRIVTVDPDSDEITQVLVLEGMHGCVHLALSPDAATLAVGCSGLFGGDPEAGHPDSGIVLVHVADELSEKQRFGSGELGGSQINGTAYASGTSLLYTTFGRWNDDRSALAAPDTLRRLDLSTGQADPDPLLESRDEPFVIADTRCSVADRVCFATDTETNGGVVHRFDLDAAGRPGDPTAIEVERAIGLPPRHLGVF